VSSLGKNYLKALGNFYLYSSLNISLVAALFTLESYLLFSCPVDWNYILFIFCSTMCLYSMHRIVGMQKVKAFEDQGRYKVIKKYKWHIIVYLIISCLVAAYCFFHLSLTTQVWLLVPSILAIAYSLPIFGNGNRLRDFNYIKIFLIGLVWSSLCFLVPMCTNESLVIQLELKPLLWLLLIERVLFMIAITIPFDIRDQEVDGAIGVQTLIHKFGSSGAKKIAIGMLGLALLLILFLSFSGLISIQYFLSLILSYILAAVLIWLADPKIKDWYYSGILDGTIGIRCALFYLLYSFL